MVEVWFMPIYEFRCEKCDEIRDMYFSVKDSPLYILCPCGGNAKRLPFPRPGHIQINMKNNQSRVWHAWDARGGEPPKSIVERLKKEDRPSNKEVGDIVVRPDELIKRGLNK